MCNHDEVYSWAANQYWKRYNSCEDDVRYAEEKVGEELDELNDDCKFLMKQVGDKGQHTLTAFLEQTAEPTARSRPEAGATPGSGLSIGAKAGIGAGVPVFVIVCTLLGFWLLKRRRRADPATLAKTQAPEFVSSKQPAPHRQSDVPEVQSLTHPRTRT